MLDETTMRSEESKKVGRSAKKPNSRSKRAGLMLPVGRFARILRKGKYAERIGEGASVYITAVLEYLAAEVLEISGNAARDTNCKRITPRHLQLAVRGDTALDELFKGIDWMQSGVIPHIEPSLLPLKTAKRVVISK